MKKIYLPLVIVFSLVFLSGCGTSEEDKQDFIVETKPFGDFLREVSISRPGRIAGSTEISVTSQVNGRVSVIYKKDGQNVVGGQQVLNIKDSVANYGLSVQRAKNALDRSVLQYDQTKISLDKNFADAANAVDSAQNSYDITQKITEQTLRKANLDYQNASVTTENLQLQLAVEKNNLSNLLDVFLHQIDTYMGVTETYRQYNDDYEYYLGIKNPTQKTQEENDILALYTLRDQIKAINDNQPNPTEIKNAVNLLDNGYKKAKLVIDGMKTVFLNTIPFVNFSQAKIDTAKSIMDGYSSSLQVANASFIAYRKQVLSSLVDNGTGIVLGLGDETADISYQTTLINTQNALFNTEMSLKNAKLNYDTIYQNKDLQLALVQNSIMDASVSYQDALSKLNKLSARAPISGVIGTVLVDVGQEVSAGTPLFTLISSDNQLVEVYVSAEESKFLIVGQDAHVDYAGDNYSGVVMSISSVADKNTLYKVVVGLDRPVDLIGDVVNVTFPIRVSSPVLPLNAITPISEYTGAIWILHGTGLKQVNVRLGRVWDDTIQIESILPPAYTIVLSDVSNYDQEKFVIKEEKQE